jgi:hypothetical protein
MPFLPPWARADDFSPPDLLGNYKVVYYEDTLANHLGRYGLYLYYPEKGAVAERHPAVIFSCGFGKIPEPGKRAYYSWLGDYLASHGFITVIFTTPHWESSSTLERVEGFKSVIAYLSEKDSCADNPLEERVRIGSIAVGGHSFGASAVIDFLVQDSRPVTAFLLAPAGSSREKERSLLLPVQVQVGDRDEITPAAFVLDLYRNLGSRQKLYLQLYRADHVRYLASEKAEAGTGERVFNPDKYPKREAACPLPLTGKGVLKGDVQRQLACRYIVSWLRYYLNRDGRYYGYIFGAQVKSDRKKKFLTRLEFKPGN